MAIWTNWHLDWLNSVNKNALPRHVTKDDILCSMRIIVVYYEKVHSQKKRSCMEGMAEVMC